MIPGSKAINHNVLAHTWFYSLLTLQDCESAWHGAIRKVSFKMIHRIHRLTIL